MGSPWGEAPLVINDANVGKVRVQEETGRGLTAVELPGKWLGAAPSPWGPGQPWPLGHGADCIPTAVTCVFENPSPTRPSVDRGKTPVLARGWGWQEAPTWGCPMSMGGCSRGSRLLRAQGVWFNVPATPGLTAFSVPEPRRPRLREGGAPASHSCGSLPGPSSGCTARAVTLCSAGRDHPTGPVRGRPAWGSAFP